MQWPVRKSETGAPRVILPAVTISEEDQAVIVEAEMPGLEKNNITVDVDKDELVLRGAPHECETPKGYTPLYRERCGYIYERRFMLSDDIDTSKINARYENGVLSVTLAKSEKTQPKRITIN